MISILMASYNGERYIAGQIESLLDQTEQGFKLFIQDDKSTDKTYKIIKEYAEKKPAKIFVKQNSANSGGSQHNFMKMMIEHKDDYVMLCDQDDIWLSDKIEVTLKMMRDMESEYGAQTPLLVHTDLKVVDKRLGTISPSYRTAMNADYEKKRLANQVIQNTLTGCTVMYNRALAELINDTPPYMVMHDWWLMLIASAFGKIGSVYEQTILYRQHDKNDIGAKDVRTMSYKINRMLNSAEVKEAISGTYLQAQSLLEVFGDRLTAEQKELLTAYSDIPNHCKLMRIAKIFRLCTFKNGLSRKVAHIIFI